MLKVSDKDTGMLNLLEAASSAKSENIQIVQDGLVFDRSIGCLGLKISVVREISCNEKVLNSLCMIFYKCFFSYFMCFSATWRALFDSRLIQGGDG